MICAYCGRDAKATKEHIISSGILDLFPECFETIDIERNATYKADPMIKDVCAECNSSKLSYVDSYGKSMIQKYFLIEYSEDEELNFEYNYTMVQKMCLKYAYNDLRSRNKDISFFDENIKNFILNEAETSPLRNVTILAGLAVNTSPVPDVVFGNRKIRWSDSPYLLSNSILMNYDSLSGGILLRPKEELEQTVLLRMDVSYIFRFNSLQILLFCWNKEILEEELHKNNIVLQYQYPYTVLCEDGKSYLSRCTSMFTYHFEKVIDVRWGQEMLDDISIEKGVFDKQYQQYAESLNMVLSQDEADIAKEQPRK